VDASAHPGQREPLIAGHRSPAGAAAARLAALGEMTGGIAHDFRNVLAVIDSGLRMAEEDTEPSEAMRCYIAAAREGIERGVKLTSQLLAFAKRQELRTIRGDVNQLLRSLERFLAYGAGPDVRVVLRLADDVPPCVLEPAQFEAAMLNLVINARDAMPNGGIVEIATQRLEGDAASIDGPAGFYARVRVKDSGQGMPPQVLRRIFDPLFTTKGEAGTGLGLAQVHAFIRLVGGHVGVDSVPGIGTTFDLLLPARTAIGSA
jgi:signal transduction histidine kinase